MIPPKSYVDEDSQGSLRVGSLGVSLDSVESLLLIWAASEAEEWAGQVVFLPL
jgi:hypothetical protein